MRGLRAGPQGPWYIYYSYSAATAWSAEYFGSADGLQIFRKQKVADADGRSPICLIRIFITKCLKTMNNFGCVLAVKCHCRYFVRLPTTKFRIWLFLAYCTVVCRLLFIILTDCCIARFIACHSMRVSCQSSSQSFARQLILQFHIRHLSDH